MEPDSQSTDPAELDEASRQALYRRLEGFEDLEDREPLFSRNPYGLGLRPSAYWRLGFGFYLRKPARASGAQLLLLGLALVLMLALWPITFRLLLMLRLLILPLAALALLYWLRQFWPRR